MDSLAPLILGREWRDHFEVAAQWENYPQL